MYVGEFVKGNKNTLLQQIADRTNNTYRNKAFLSNSSTLTFTRVYIKIKENLCSKCRSIFSF